MKKNKIIIFMIILFCCNSIFASKLYLSKIPEGLTFSQSLRESNVWISHIRSNLKDPSGEREYAPTNHISFMSLLDDNYNLFFCLNLEDQQAYISTTEDSLLEGIEDREISLMGSCGLSLNVIPYVNSILGKWVIPKDKFYQVIMLIENSDSFVLNLKGKKNNKPVVYSEYFKFDSTIHSHFISDIINGYVELSIDEMKRLNVNGPFITLKDDWNGKIYYSSGQWIIYDSEGNDIGSIGIPLFRRSNFDFNLKKTVKYPYEVNIDYRVFDRESLNHEDYMEMKGNHNTYKLYDLGSGLKESDSFELIDDLYEPREIKIVIYDSNNVEHVNTYELPAIGPILKYEGEIRKYGYYPY